MTTRPIYLLSTGPLLAETIKRTAARDIILDVLSFITTERVVDEDVRGLAGRPLVAVFTSVNALEAVKEGLVGMTPRWKVYCTGGATRQGVADYFGGTAVAGVAESARALAELIRREEGWREGGNEREEGRREGGGLDDGGREIFFFCGDLRREELPSVLRQAGFIVNERIVYRTLLTPHKTERIYDGIAFFSPSAVESYFSVNTVAESTTLFAIGPTTAAAIKTRCSNLVVIGDQPEKDALIRKMSGYFSNKRRSQ
jgi:uroporphyrinogen-III synthase